MDRNIQKLAIASFILRLIIAPLYIDPPTIPHDFMAYVTSGKCFTEAVYGVGDCLFDIAYHPEYPNIYGIALQALMAVPYNIAPDSFMALKILSIIFDTLNIILVFEIARNFMKKDAAIYCAILYGFSYIVFFSSSVLGNDDNYFMFFTLLAIHYLLRGKSLISAASYSFALLFKISPIILTPAIGLYLWKTAGIKRVVGYAIIFTLVFGTFFGMHYTYSPKGAMDPYMIFANTDFGMFGVGPLNLLRMSYGLPYHLAHPEIPRDFSQDNPLSPMNFTGPHTFSSYLRSLSSLSTIASILIVTLYMLAFQLEDIKTELLRNIFQCTFIVMMMQRVVDPPFFIWFFPYLLIIFTASTKDIPKVSSLKALHPETFAFLLCILSAAIYSGIYRWSQDIDTPSKVLLGLGVLAAASSAWILFHRYQKGPRTILLGLTLVFAMDRVLNANILSSTYFLFEGLIDVQTYLQIMRFGWNYAATLIMLAITLSIIKIAHNQCASIRSFD